MKFYTLLFLILLSTTHLAQARRSASAGILYKLGAPAGPEQPNFHGYRVLTQIPLSSIDLRTFLRTFVPQLKLQPGAPSQFHPDFGLSIVYGRMTSNPRSHTDYVFSEGKTEGFEDDGSPVHGSLSPASRKALLKF